MKPHLLGKALAIVTAGASTLAFIAWILYTLVQLFGFDVVGGVMVGLVILGAMTAAIYNDLEVEESRK